MEIIKDELNIKAIDFVKKENSEKIEVELDLNISPELKREGEFRELVRAVQDTRKNKGLTPSDVISLVLADEYKDVIAGFENDLKKTVLAKDVSFGLPDGEKISITVQ